jgi:hypothetical protein
MKRLGMWVVLGAMLCGPALAADLPPIVKAAPLTAPKFSNGYSGSGFYFGLWADGGAGSANGTVPGTNANGLTDTFGSIGGLIGYNYAPANSPVTYFGEVKLGYQNLNGNTVGLSFTGPLTGDVVLAVGAPLAQIMSILPNFNLPALPSFTLPAGVTAVNSHGYIGFDGHFYDASIDYGLASGKEWIFQPGAKIGILTQLSNNLVVDTGVGIFGAGNSICAGPVTCVQPGTTLIASVEVKF